MNDKINLQSRRAYHQPRRMLAGLSVLLLLLGSVMLSGCGSPKNQPVANEPPPPSSVTADKAINILVLGVDERQDDIGRSDTMFVVTVDPETKRMSLLSIPRDTRVQIPGHGWDKINHAYAFGGAELTKQVVQGLLGTPIDYSVEISFDGFKKVINALGGVTIDVDKAMHYADPYDDGGGLYIDLQPGVQKLDGQTAIEYVRYRDQEGDIGRVARQQKFLKAVLQQLSKPEMITKLPTIVRQIHAAVTTDMPTEQMLKLVPVMSSVSQQGLAVQTVTGTPVYIQDISYWIPDIQDLRNKVAQMQGITIDERYRADTQRLVEQYQGAVPDHRQPDPGAGAPQSLSQTVKVKVINASGQDNAGIRLAGVLREQGFDVVQSTVSTDIRKNTAVLINHADNHAVHSLAKLPFDYALYVTDESIVDVPLTVMIGQDFQLK